MKEIQGGSILVLVSERLELTMVRVSGSQLKVVFHNLGAPETEQLIGNGEQLHKAVFKVKPKWLLSVTKRFFTPTEIFATARPGSNETVRQAARRPQLYQGPTRGPTAV